MDGLEQYQNVGCDLTKVINANCWAHARRDYADAVKATRKRNPEAVKQLTTYQALARIGTIYKLKGALKEMSGAA